MTKKILVEIITPTRKVLSVETESVVVPASTGYLGVLVNHAPLVTSLGIGVLKYKEKGEEKKVAICGGFLEIRDNKVSVMADTAECSNEIDVERAKRAEERARKRLREKSKDIDVFRAELALRRAIARQEAAK